MGLTRAQLLERSRKKLFDYLNEKATDISESSKKFNKVWNKYPICVRDICVLSALITKKGEMLFTDYDLEKDTYPRKFARKGKDLEREYLDSILEQITKHEEK